MALERTGLLAERTSFARLSSCAMAGMLMSAVRIEVSSSAMFLQLVCVCLSAYEQFHASLN